MEKALSDLGIEPVKQEKAKEVKKPKSAKK